jgi:secernin
MCDLFVAMPDTTRTGTMVFGKNSDRPAGECQVLHYGRERPARPGAKIRCSYVRVPDSEGALATIGCRPYWCWGYETGLNEASVIGGNAAVFTRAGRRTAGNARLGLTGMELLRFGLERGSTAEYAVESIIELLERHGQWGSAVRGKTHADGSYENSFVLADRREAWVLETAGKEWAAERVTQGTRAISNELTIRNKWHKSSANLIEHARDIGCWDGVKKNFDFAMLYSDHENYPRQVSHIRRMRIQDLLERSVGSIDEFSAMGILRDHYEDTFLGGPQFSRFLPDFHTICMHDSPAGFTWGDTATSMVVALRPDIDRPPLVWTSYLPPCSSIYLPFAFAENLPEAVLRTGTAGLGSRKPASTKRDRFHEDSLWWRMHRLVKALSLAPERRIKELRSILDPLEARLLRQAGEADAGRDSLNPAEWNRMMSRVVSGLLTKLGSLERRWHLD